MSRGEEGGRVEAHPGASPHSAKHAGVSSKGAAPDSGQGGG